VKSLELWPKWNGANLLAWNLFAKDTGVQMLHGQHYMLPLCNVPLHLVTVPGNRTHGRLPQIIDGPLIQFISTSHCVIVSTVPIVIDMTVFSPDTLFRTMVL